MQERVFLGALALAVALAPSVVRADIPVRAEVQEIPRAIQLTVRDGAVVLTMEDAIRLAVERNLGLATERYRVEETDLVLFGTYGIYDINAAVFGSALEETSPAASNLDGADVQLSERQELDLSLSRLVPIGGTVTTSMSNTRTDTNSFFATLNPSFRIDLDVLYSQPLLRNFGREATNYRIRLAKIDREIGRETFETQLSATLRSVEEAYWSLVGAREQLKVAEQSLDLANQLHGQNKVRVEVGTLAPLELVRSEAGIATREEGIILAQAAVGNAEDRLRQILNVEDGELWGVPIEPVSDPEITAVSLDVERAIATALASRPEVRSRRRLLDRQDETVRFVRNQQLPQLLLNLRYGYNGLGGDVTNRDFFTGEILSQAPGDYGDAVQQVLDQQFDGWQLSVNMAYPIRNRERRAATAQAEIALERGEVELAELELAVSTDVRRLARAVETARKARDSAEATRILEERNLDAEQKRYDNGMSTSYQVLEVQEDLTAARSREVNATTSYRIALIAYYQATGELIEESGVELVEAD